MPTFSAPDGTELAYHAYGDGPPVICLPGGPTRAAYLGDLGGLPAHRRMIALDLRGTGGSARPDDVASYRCDRMVEDVEALRAHLGLERMDLLAHCGGANLAVQYAARHPARVSRLALVTPSTKAVDIPISGELRRAVARLRAGEPWFPAAFAALEAIGAGRATEADWPAITPFTYGRWDSAAQAHHAAEGEDQNREAAAGFAAEGAFDPDVTRAALAAFGAPVLVLAGELDIAAPPAVMAEFATLFPNATLVVQPEAGHYPWLDAPDRFVKIIAEFLS